MNPEHSCLVTFWSPFPPIGQPPFAGIFVPFLRRFGDIQCLDLKGSGDPRTLRLLRQADLVVVLLRQDYREISRLFCESRIRLPNCVYLIIDYVEGYGLTLLQIGFDFRIPNERLGCIPYSPRMWEERANDDDGSFPGAHRRELGRDGHLMLLNLGF